MNFETKKPEMEHREEQRTTELVRKSTFTSFNRSSVGNQSSQDTASASVAKHFARPECLRTAVAPFNWNAGFFAAAFFTATFFTGAFLPKSFLAGAFLATALVAGAFPTARVAKRGALNALAETKSSAKNVAAFIVEK